MCDRCNNSHMVLHIAIGHGNQSYEAELPMPPVLPDAEIIAAVRPCPNCTRPRKQTKQ